MANAEVVSNDYNSTGAPFLLPSSSRGNTSSADGDLYTSVATSNAQPISELEYLRSLFNTPDFSMGASTSADRNPFNYFSPLHTRIDVSQMPSTSANLQQPASLNEMCEQKPRIHAIAKRKNILKNTAGFSTVRASQPHTPEALDADEQRRRLSCQLIEPLRLRISSSRRGGSVDSPATAGPSSSNAAGSPTSTPSTSAIYASTTQQQPFNFLPSFPPSTNFQQKQEFMAQLMGAFQPLQQELSTNSSTVNNNFSQNLPNMWNTNTALLENQPPLSKLKRLEGETVPGPLSEEQDVVVVHEKVVTASTPRKLLPSDNYTGEVITLDDEEDEEDRLARFLCFYSNSADTFNETFSDVEDEEDDEDEEPEEQLEEDLKEVENEKDDLKEDELRQKLEETIALKSIFAKYKKKAQKRENKLIDRLKCERKKNLELSEECSTINRKLKESEMVRVHLQDGLETLEELRTENFQLRQTSESRLSTLNSTVQVKLDLQHKLDSLREQNKRLDDEKEKMSREHSCVICLDSKREILFMPCLHFNTCEPCSKTSMMTHCSTCRQLIMGKLKVYQ